jgi:hypothetical protein
MQSMNGLSKTADKVLPAHTEWVCTIDTVTKVMGTPAVRGLEDLFSAVLERFLEPIHDLRVYCKN